MHQNHNVFHISLIKQYRSGGRTQPPPPPELVEDHPEWTVDQILDHRVVKRGNQRKLEYLIGWEVTVRSTTLGSQLQMHRMLLSLCRTTGSPSLLTKD